jgi:DNA-binding MarR family transcriptional regulator
VREDHVDRTLARAGIARTDAGTVEILSRLHRAVSFIDDQLEAAFGELQLKMGEVDVLIILANGANQPQSPTAVAGQLLCSTGAMTHRLDRLEKAGLLKREHATEDRRSILLAITPEGRRAAKRAATARDSMDGTLIPGLTTAERKTLSGLLRKMLLEFEASDST